MIKSEEPGDSNSPNFFWCRNYRKNCRNSEFPNFLVRQSAPSLNPSKNWFNDLSFFFWIALYPFGSLLSFNKSFNQIYHLIKFDYSFWVTFLIHGSPMISYEKNWKWIKGKISKSKMEETKKSKVKILKLYIKNIAFYKFLINLFVFFKFNQVS